MTDQKAYCIPGLDLQQLAQALMQFFQGKGYQTQMLQGPGAGGVTVQAKRGSGWITTATSQALTVIMTLQGDNLVVQTGGARWTEKIVSGAVGLIVFWPLVALPAYGAYKQKEIIDQTWQFIDQYIAALGGAPASIPVPAVTAMPAAPVATPAAQARCPSCNQPVRAGAKFCDSCGAPLVLACAQCGAELRPGAKFCDRCGAPATAQA